jgi:hypothetical protein
MVLAQKQTYMQINEIKDPEISPHSYTYNRYKTVSLTNIAGKTGDPHVVD